MESKGINEYARKGSGTPAVGANRTQRGHGTKLFKFGSGAAVREQRDHLLNGLEHQTGQLFAQRKRVGFQLLNCCFILACALDCELNVNLGCQGGWSWIFSLTPVEYVALVP